jgi:hypothetical protein
MDGQTDDPCASDFAEHTRHLFVDVAQGGAISTGARPARRAVFRKTHGIVAARLTLNAQRPATVRRGIFADERYDVWLRFSSDSAPDESDATKGTVGIGMKLFGVAGPTLADVDPEAPTADILLQNYDVFFVDTGYDMCRFTDLSLSGKGQEWSASHPETDVILQEMQKREESLLTATYWSVLPYACGPDLAVKYRVTPQASGLCLAPDTDENRLRTDLRKRLAAGGAEFLFSIQIPNPGANLPTDRATFRWSEVDAPFVPVGKIEIPQQDITAEGQETYGETLAFSPWRVPEANRPLGSIAESRRRAYPSSAAKRHYVNGSPEAEPHIPRKA